MAYIHATTREWVGTVVYWGPGLAGKTTSIKWLADNAAPLARGKLQRLATETEHPATFEFLPLSLGLVRGVSLRLHVYTTFGHISFDKARRQLADLADGIVFVADSHPDRQDANVMAHQELLVCANEEDPNRSPRVVVQCNKQDLPEAVSVKHISTMLNVPEDHCLASVARSGEGVWESLLTCAKHTVLHHAALLDGAPPS